MQADPLALITLEEEHLPQVLRQPDANTDRRCPECQGLLDRYKYAYDSPITLDACGSCEGVWVEDGELAKIDQLLWQCRHPATPEATLQANKERALAEMSAEHEQAMGRLARLRGLCTMLSHRPAW
jgi:Zn-finger nucleic acid-binding protein